MKLIKLLIAVAVVLAVGALLLYVERPKALRLSDRKLIRFERMADELTRSEIVLFGENHDSPAVHRSQLALIERFHHKEIPCAIGLEMFSTPTQPQLDQWVAGRLDQDAFINLYYREWNMPWPLYRDIFLYARQHRIPLVALNVPHEISRKVARYGFDSLSAQERKRLPQGLTCTIDPAYRSFISQAFRMHKNSDRMFENFCQVQMLWNKVMASRIEEYLAANPGRRMIVLAGAGHAVKAGIPAELREKRTAEQRVVVPEQHSEDPDTISPRQADYLLLYRPAWTGLLGRWGGQP